VGDAEFQSHWWEDARYIRQGGRTVLFVSHNMAAEEFVYKITTT
jgi:hypothetical protein